MDYRSDNNSNQLGFALEILKLLAQKPHKKAELSIALGDRGFISGDLSQKVARTISKLKDCGFEIKIAPNRPYELVESAFPVILSTEQRQALAMAAELLADMGFSTQASQIYRIGNFNKAITSNLAVDFHPPADYSQDNLDEILRQLQQRLQQKRRFVIWYRNTKGEERNWDLDKSELRLHNGSLYLFGLVPDWHSWNISTKPNVEQNCAFRIDRLVRVGAASYTPWTYTKFPTIDVTYRLTGALATYKPRRPHEKIISSPENTAYVDILTQEDYIFWFHQRILQYGASATVLDPPWIAKQIKNAHKKAYENYSIE
ncbi:WYL domain-containing protein [Nostoc sp. FACHB-87]|uniref:WYL domain-containing protein n=1 Tax=Nostocaceae TaxID=1162 RepID=UPI001686A8EC|nr:MULTISPECIES: WYL domain-containing protein [Nostocaceae]MBD2458959.1 WYL domain-containing protein [Nostoc sp. FACHB-87]MBD2479951.1 WYL domain-containing protein [Anabaena sp. FACHB-83]